MAYKTIKQINSGLNYLFRKKHFLTASLRRLLCNTLIQPHFDYMYTAWYPNLCKNLKNKIQTTQKKCVRFCLNLDKMVHISENEFKLLDWLPISNRINQCILSTIFEFVNDMGSNYLNEVFQCFFWYAERTSVFIIFIGFSIGLHFLCLLDLNVMCLQLDWVSNLDVFSQY